MQISSTAFENNGLIPQQFACDGDLLNPPLVFSAVPDDAVSLALIVEDPDAPAGLWIHWIVWNIDPQTQTIAAGTVPAGVVGKNSSGNASWDDICPPSGEHRYVFKVFALNKKLELDSATATRDDFYQQLEGSVIEKAELMGKYSKA